MTCNNEPFSHIKGASVLWMIRLPEKFADGHFAGWMPTSQVRTESGVLVADLEVTWYDPAIARVLVLRKIVTTDWPIGAASFDVRLVGPDGFAIYTEPLRFYIVKGNTDA